MKTDPLRIAILGDGFFNWNGGIDFLHYCANALVLQKKNRPIDLFLLSSNNTSLLPRVKIQLRNIRNLLFSLISSSSPTTSKIDINVNAFNSFSDLQNDINIQFYNGSMENLAAVGHRLKIDAVLPSFFPLGNNFPLPWIGYIYDMQHKYYSNFFTPNECKDRDRHFREMLSQAKTIIVNSQAAKEDIRKYFPEYSCEIFSLPFSPYPRQQWLDKFDSLNLRNKYHLPDKYFLVSNQFWVHKSHLTAFEALAILLKQNPSFDVHIICTGPTEDRRFPGYFMELNQKVNLLGLKDRIHFLGYIPKIDQIQIMKESVAVLQPTLFEGGPGGGAVYDALALGVPVIISDIPVNLEIKKGLNLDHNNIFYFKVGSSEDMAVKMLSSWQKIKNIPDIENLKLRGNERLNNFGDTLLKAINHSLENQ